MEKFILDTSIFTNPDIYGQFGQNTETAIQKFLYIAQQSSVEFYMPSSVYDELNAMKDLDKIAPDFESVVRIRSPRKFNIQIPASIVYEFIEEVRKRIDRGLRIAEEHTKLGHAGSTEKDVGPIITRLRERYRETLRYVESALEEEERNTLFQIKVLREAPGGQMEKESSFVKPT